MLELVKLLPDASWLKSAKPGIQAGFGSHPGRPPRAAGCTRHPSRPGVPQQFLETSQLSQTSVCRARRAWGRGSPGGMQSTPRKISSTASLDKPSRLAFLQPGVHDRPWTPIPLIPSSLGEQPGQGHLGRGLQCNLETWPGTSAPLACPLPRCP